jgi:hypothetical protein
VENLIAAITALNDRRLKPEEILEVKHIHPISKRVHYLVTTALQLPFFIEHFQSVINTLLSLKPGSLGFSTAVRKGNPFIYCLHSRNMFIFKGPFLISLSYPSPSQIKLDRTTSDD